MTIICVHCGGMLSRYAPTSDRQATLCQRCAEGLSTPTPARHGPLYCGREACAFEIIPYTCLMAEATSTPIDV